MQVVRRTGGRAGGRASGRARGRTGSAGPPRGRINADGCFIFVPGPGPKTGGALRGLRRGAEKTAR
eukprot:4800270-Pyramimonas_sp.AAC.1